MIDLIKLLNLKPHPEGGFYKETFRSPIKCSVGSDAGSSIYYYLSRQDFSAWHRVNVDEIWHYYAGSSLMIHMIKKTGQLETFYLGHPLQDTRYRPQVVVPANTWLAVESCQEETYSLVGCDCIPAFTFEGFELASSAQLSQQYPAHSDIIERLTRR